MFSIISIVLEFVFLVCATDKELLSQSIINKKMHLHFDKELFNSIHYDDEGIIIMRSTPSGVIIHSAQNDTVI